MKYIAIANTGKPTPNANPNINCKLLFSLFSFFAGGVFVFRNNEANRTAMQKVIDVYDEVYTDGTEYARGITDEVFFSGVCENVVDLGGGLNH